MRRKSPARCRNVDGSSSCPSISEFATTAAAERAGAIWRHTAWMANSETHCAPSCQACEFCEGALKDKLCDAMRQQKSTNAMRCGLAMVIQDGRDRFLVGHSEHKSAQRHVGVLAKNWYHDRWLSQDMQAVKCGPASPRRSVGCSMHVRHHSTTNQRPSTDDAPPLHIGRPTHEIPLEDELARQRRQADGVCDTRASDTKPNNLTSSLELV